MSRERKQKRDENPALVIVLISARYSNEEMIDCLRQAKDVRDQRDDAARVVCLLDGYDEDPRELHDIPEARAVAMRAWDLGIGSFLEVTTTCEAPLSSLPRFTPDGRPLGCAHLGAWELWRLAHGDIKSIALQRVQVADLQHFIKHELAAANERADQLLGN